MKAISHTPVIGIDLGDRFHEVCLLEPDAAAPGRARIENERKSDVRDAEMLARIGGFDAEPLHSVRHRGEAEQRALKVVQCRDALVANRTRLINHVRASLKSLGLRGPGDCGTAAFAARTRDCLRREDFETVAPAVETIERLSQNIRRQDRRIRAMASREYPQARRLMEQVPGVGPITALSFVLIVGDPRRFDNAREIGPFGPPSALREAGQRRARKGGGKADRKKAVVAVARKTAVLMLALLKDPEAVYQPFPSRKESA